jgi:hypothetical protein
MGKKRHQQKPPSVPKPLTEADLTAKAEAIAALAMHDAHIPTYQPDTLAPVTRAMTLSLGTLVVADFSPDGTTDQYAYTLTVSHFHDPRKGPKMPPAALSVLRLQLRVATTDALQKAGWFARTVTTPLGAQVERWYHPAIGIPPLVVSGQILQDA